MEDSVSFKDRPTFNIGLGYTNFLLYSLSLCDTHSRNKEYDQWYQEQMVLFRWVSTKMKKEQMDVFDEKKKNIETLLLTYIRKKNNALDIYNALHDMELFLRNIIKVSGLEMRGSEDPRLALM